MFQDKSFEDLTFPSVERKSRTQRMREDGDSDEDKSVNLIDAAISS